MVKIVFVLWLAKIGEGKLAVAGRSIIPVSGRYKGPVGVDVGVGVGVGEGVGVGNSSSSSCSC